MNTIIIPVSDKRPEDNILDLVNLIQEEFPDEIIRVSNALVIETDIPQAVVMFKAIAAKYPLISKTTNGKDQPGCIDCGTPVKKEGNRCKPCANKFYRSRKKDKKSFEIVYVDGVEQNGADHDQLESLP